MGIVRFALRFPHTFYVLAALIVFLGVTAIRSMPTDIFPQIDIPVVTVIWSYTGLSTPEMEQRVSTYSQYSISSNVNGIKNMESQTLNGISVQKIYFQPDVNLDLAIAQIVSATNAIRALMPPGIQPPIIVQFNASSVPVLQLSLTSNTLNEQQLYDYGIYRLRQQLAPVPRRDLSDAGRRQIPADHGRSRSGQAAGQGADPARRGERGQRAESDAAGRHGEDRRQAIHHQAPTRSPPPSPSSTTSRSNLPTARRCSSRISARCATPIAVQQNIVRKNGLRAVLLTVIKNGNASTLDVVNGVKAALDVARAAAPPGLNINELFDQSTFVTNSVDERGARRRHRRRR